MKIRLNNGVEMPMIGFGTYQMPPRITQRCVEEALEVGYRHIDTAQCYGNEREVGRAIRQSKIPRGELFVTTKLWGGRGFDDTLRSIENSLRALDVGAIDLLLIHEPTGNFNEIWRAMEAAHREGKLRAIGVSNFLESNFERLMRTAEIVPAVDQIETHVFRQQRGMREILKRHGVAHEAWSPLAAGQNGFFDNPILLEIARAHGKSTAQIGLKFLVQQGIVVIPKSTHIERMRENLELDGFELSTNELDRLRALDEGRSLFNWW